jgi:hypothetical protein
LKRALIREFLRLLQDEDLKDLDKKKIKLKICENVEVEIVLDFKNKKPRLKLIKNR